MNRSLTQSFKTAVATLALLVLGFANGTAQEEQNNLSMGSPYHNQVFFNRYLINPTFSVVRENKSYLNILQRSQYTTFEDNVQNYYMGFSNRLSERTGLGLGVYGQWMGVMQEFGFNANWATSVRLGENTKMAFGTNVTYQSVGLDKNRVVASEEDPELLDTKKQNKVAIQPGIALTVGNFDFGLYASDLFRYNQSTNEFSVNVSDKTIDASVQYTHYFKQRSGMLENARLMPLVQVGRNEDNSMYYATSLLLDLPKYGWFQTTLDQQYGLSMGLGFILYQSLSLGYVMEKDFFESGGDLGWNHELSLAYTFKEDVPQGKGILADTENVSKDSQIDQIIRNYEEQIKELKEGNTAVAQQATTANPAPSTQTVSNTTALNGTPASEVVKTTYIDANAASTASVDENSLAYQNRLILDELMLRQDSIEEARVAMFEKRFETMVRLLRNQMSQEGDNSQNVVQVGHRRVPQMQPVSQRAQAQFKIKAHTKADVIGLPSGYYVIANVYSEKRYLNAFMDSLEKKGLAPKHFFNKENGLFYVYLANFDYENDARSAYVSNLGGTYSGEKWIMHVYDATTVAGVAYGGR